MGLAKINGLFRLTRDAELKYTSDGKPILNMGLACSEKFGDRENQLFLDATAFGKPAEILNQWAGEKGTQLFLSGKLHTETWEKDGVKNSKVKMTVESFDFVSKPKNEQYQAPEPTYEDHPQKQQPKHTDYQPKKQPMPQPDGGALSDMYDEEIPF